MHSHSSVSVQSASKTSASAFFSHPIEVVEAAIGRAPKIGPMGMRKLQMVALAVASMGLVSCNQAPMAPAGISASPLTTPAVSPETQESSAAPAATAIEKRSTRTQKLDNAPTNAENAEKMESENPAKTEIKDNLSKQPEKIAQAGEDLFVCRAEGGKSIILRDLGSTIEYSFGRPGAKQELELSVPRAQASTWQWKGIGRAMNYSVNVPNGDTVYSVFWSADRLAQTVESGVNVLINDKLVATVLCREIVENNLKGVDLKEEMN